MLIEVFPSVTAMRGRFGQAQGQACEYERPLWATRRYDRSWPLSDIESDRHEPPALGLVTELTRPLRPVELPQRYGHGIRFQDQMGAHMPTPMSAPSAIYPFASICTRVWSLVVKR